MIGADRRGPTSARRGLTVLGKIPTVPKPINLPSQRLENRGLDPNVEIVPKGSVTWAVTGKSPPTNSFQPGATTPSSSTTISASSTSAWGSSVTGSSGGDPNPNPNAWPSIEEASSVPESGRPSSSGSGSRPSSSGGPHPDGRPGLWRPSTASSQTSNDRPHSADDGGSGGRRADVARKEAMEEGDRKFLGGRNESSGMGDAHSGNRSNSEVERPKSADDKRGPDERRHPPNRISDELDPNFHHQRIGGPPHWSHPGPPGPHSAPPGTYMQWRAEVPPDYLPPGGRRNNNWGNQPDRWHPMNDGWRPHDGPPPAHYFPSNRPPMIPPPEWQQQQGGGYPLPQLMYEPRPGFGPPPDINLRPVAFRGHPMGVGGPQMYPPNFNHGQGAHLGYFPDPGVRFDRGRGFEARSPHPGFGQVPRGLNNRGYAPHGGPPVESEHRDVPVEGQKKFLEKETKQEAPKKDDGAAEGQSAPLLWGDDEGDENDAPPPLAPSQKLGAAPPTSAVPTSVQGGNKKPELVRILKRTEDSGSDVVAGGKALEVLEKPVVAEQVSDSEKKKVRWDDEPQNSQATETRSSARPSNPHHNQLGGEWRGHPGPLGQPFPHQVQEPLLPNPQFSPDIRMIRYPPGPLFQGQGPPMYGPRPQHFQQARGHDTGPGPMGMAPRFPPHQHHGVQQHVQGGHPGPGQERKVSLDRTELPWRKNVDAEGGSEGRKEKSVPHVTIAKRGQPPIVAPPVAQVSEHVSEKESEMVSQEAAEESKGLTVGAEAGPTIVPNVGQVDVGGSDMAKGAIPGSASSAGGAAGPSTEETVIPVKLPAADSKEGSRKIHGKGSRRERVGGQKVQGRVDSRQVWVPSVTDVQDENKQQSDRAELGLQARLPLQAQSQPQPQPQPQPQKEMVTRTPQEAEANPLSQKESDSQQNHRQHGRASRAHGYSQGQGPPHNRSQPKPHSSSNNPVSKPQPQSHLSLRNQPPVQPSGQSQVQAGSEQVRHQQHNPQMNPRVQPQPRVSSRGPSQTQLQPKLQPQSTAQNQPKAQSHSSPKGPQPLLRSQPQVATTKQSHAQAKVPPVPSQPQIQPQPRTQPQPHEQKPTDEVHEAERGLENGRAGQRLHRPERKLYSPKPLAQQQQKDSGVGGRDRKKAVATPSVGQVAAPTVAPSVGQVATTEAASAGSGAGASLRRDDSSTTAQQGKSDGNSNMSGSLGRGRGSRGVGRGRGGRDSGAHGRQDRPRDIIVATSGEKPLAMQ